MPDLLFETHDTIAIIIFNRPERRNAITPEMIVRLHDAWVEFRDDDNLRVAILTGAGNDAFSAGADLARLIPLLTKARAPEDEWDHRLIKDRSVFQAGVLRRFELYKPIIAAVNGTSLAAATEMLQATDLRLAVPEATFGLSEPKRGIVPGSGSMVRLARQIPYYKAMEILLTGEPMSAEEALRIGLINEIVPRERLMDRAFELARTVAANGPLANARAFVFGDLQGQGDDGFSPADASVGKLYVAEMASFVAVEAIHILAGNGYMEDYVIERLVRDAKLIELGGGTTEIQELTAARWLMANYEI